MSRVLLRVDRVVVDAAALVGCSAHEWATALEEALATVMGGGPTPVPARSARAVLRARAAGPSPSDIAQAVAAAVELAPGQRSGSAPRSSVGGRPERGGAL